VWFADDGARDRHALALDALDVPTSFSHRSTLVAGGLRVAEELSSLLCVLVGLVAVDVIPGVLASGGIDRLVSDDEPHAGDDASFVASLDGFLELFTGPVPIHVVMDDSPV
jgi:hypothetical protein